MSTKVLRLTLSIWIFEQLAAEAGAANIPSVQLIRRFLSTRYEQPETVYAGSSGNAVRPTRDRSFAALRDGEGILSCAVDAYGRIEQTLGKVPTTPAGRKQLTAIGKDLVILGDGTALLRELLDLVEELRQACAPGQEATHRPMPHAANDHQLRA
ncbi:MAG: hypothetical protein ABJC13_09165 [Acidobacteriota bacterium]